MTTSVDVLRDALEQLLADVEAIAGTPNAYGMPLEDPDHPFHSSAMAARTALSMTATPKSE
ncbi:MULTISPECIES: hypothetical protein [Azospirillaceae]|uniref:Uncharacterized protein n=1 Tax=Rhodocista pekingensis TaxID=201185 RepID=A0ABW2KUS5_9PROT|nr:hypothetical protein [Oleisolibacter albus]